MKRKRIPSSRVVFFDGFKEKTGLDSYEYSIACTIYNYCHIAKNATCYLPKEVLFSIAGIGDASGYDKLKRLQALGLVSKLPEKKGLSTQYVTTERWNKFYREVQAYEIYEDMEALNIKKTTPRAGVSNSGRQTQYKTDKKEKINNNKAVVKNDRILFDFLGNFGEELIERFESAFNEVYHIHRETGILHQIKKELVKSFKEQSPDEIKYNLNRWLDDLDVAVNDWHELIEEYLSSDTKDTSSSSFNMEKEANALFRLLKYGTEGRITAFG